MAERAVRETQLICVSEDAELVVFLLEKTVMDLRESVKNLTNTLESKTVEFDTRLKNSENQLKQLIRESTHVGTIAYFANQTAPIGWLKANGQLVSRTLYSNLFSAIGTHFGSGDGSNTFTLPDLRGEFIRGWSDGRDVDKDRPFGTFQWGSTIPLVSSINDDTRYSASTQYQNRFNFVSNLFDGGFQYDIPSAQILPELTLPNLTDYRTDWYYSEPSGAGKVTSWHLFHGTRPRNIAFLACIK